VKEDLEVAVADQQQDLGRRAMVEAEVVDEANQAVIVAVVVVAVQKVVAHGAV